MMSNTRKLPAAACQLMAEFALGDNGDDAKTAPVRLVARSAEPVRTPWGNFVHDLDGMELAGGKSRIPLDWCHNSYELMGYLNHFGVEDEGLVASGAIVPYKDGDMANEVLYKSKQGVPYQASIMFSEGTVIEDYAEGETAEANGKEYAGPVTVFRKWPLNGVAVCPYGADPYTESMPLGKDECREITVHVSRFSGDSVSVEDKPAEAEAVETEEVVEPVDAVETVEEVKDESVDEGTPDGEETPEETPEESAEEEATVDTEAVESVEAGKQEAAAPGAAFMAAFGEALGAVYFAKGLSLDEAKDAHIGHLTAELARLSQALVSDRGEEEPVEFTPEATAREKAIKEMTKQGQSPAAAALAVHFQNKLGK